MSDNSVKIIFHRDFQECPVAGKMFLYTSNTDQLEKILERYGPYRTSLVVTASCIPKLQNIINKYCIYEMFILGDCTGLNIGNKEVRIIQTNEQNLLFDVLYAAARYTHREEIIQRKRGNHDLANAFRQDCRNLLKQIKKFL
jgi:hypothetical protein